MKVLVVDDQPDVAAGILDGVDWRALHVEKAYSALSAAEAKALLLREKIDILLCDIEMPGENGLSLVAWLRKEGLQTKCIFLTAHADFPYAQKALQLGAVDYLLQPASYQSIETAIRGAAEQLQEERLSQVYEALGKSVERETLDFRRNVLREYLLGIRRGPQKVAEKAAAFGFLASSRAYRSSPYRSPPKIKPMIFCSMAFKMFWKSFCRPVRSRLQSSFWSKKCTWPSWPWQITPQRGRSSPLSRGWKPSAALAAGSCTWAFPAIAARNASALKGCPRNTSSFAGATGTMWPAAVG